MPYLSQSALYVERRLLLWLNRRFDCRHLVNFLQAFLLPEAWQVLDAGTRLLVWQAHQNIELCVRTLTLYLFNISVVILKASYFFIWQTRQLRACALQFLFWRGSFASYIWLTTRICVHVNRLLRSPSPVRHRSYEVRVRSWWLSHTLLSIGSVFEKGTQTLIFVSPFYNGKIRIRHRSIWSRANDLFWMLGDVRRP